jgi:parallel beta-helix repeat protein
MFHLLSRLFGNHYSRNSQPVRPRRPKTLRLELLEDRWVPATLFVDPNVSPTASIFHTIGDAVNAAHSGDTIKVVAGTYRENVDVKTTGLKILGGQVRVSTEPIGPSQIFPQIIDTQPSFILDAGNITISGFAFHNVPTAITTSAATAGYHILNNSFFDVTTGVHLDTSVLPTAATTTVSGNVFTNDGTGPGVLDDILVEGVGARNVVISGNSFSHGAEGDTSIDVNAGTVGNLQILNNSFTQDNGIDLANVFGATVNGNVFVGSGTSAIVLGGGVSGSEIANNTIINTVTATPGGIVLGNDTVSTLDTGNKIVGNTIIGMGVGILLNPASNNTITGNSVVNSTSVGIELLNGSTGNTISGNTVVNSGANGIAVKSSNNNTLSGNVSNHNQESGISLEGVSGNTVGGNTANYNTEAGINMVNSSHNTLSHNTTSLNSSGFDFDNASNNTLLGNDAELNNTEGYLLLDGCQLNTFTSNKAISNRTVGFLATINSSANTFDRNIAIANLNNGLDLVGDGYVVTNNTVNHNGIDGISVNGSHELIKGNTVNDNSRNGLFLGISSSTVSGNTVQRNGVDGIQVGGSSNTVSGNTVRDNKRDGIDFVAGSTGNTITLNTALGNGATGGGFDLFDGSGTTTANTWTKNTAVTRNPAGLG